jgi:hypothetical protein
MKTLHNQQVSLDGGSSSSDASSSADTADAAQDAASDEAFGPSRMVGGPRQ